MKSAPSSQQAYRPYPSFSTAQTLLWFIGGVAEVLKACL